LSGHQRRVAEAITFPDGAFALISQPNRRDNSIAASEELVAMMPNPREHGCQLVADTYW